jgi:glycogen debranching enzyme
MTSREVPFYIPATGTPSRRRLTLKHNDTFAVFDNHGDIGASAGGTDGLFDRDTRFLSQLRLLINGQHPVLLGSAIRDDNLTLQVDLTNADVFEADRLLLAKDTVHIARTIYLSDGSRREHMTIFNRGAEDIRLTLSLAFASDFADIFEVRGCRRNRRGITWSRVLATGTVVLYYRGLDGALRETALSFEPAPTLQMESVATYTLDLPAGGRQTVFVTASCRGLLRSSGPSFFKGLVALHRERRHAMLLVAAVETSNNVLNEILCRSMSDLAMLTTSTPDGLYPYAGIPWYSTSFGRDAIITALETLWLNPALAAGVLRHLARYQAMAEDARYDASPGKILHEMRDGEMAAIGEVPFRLYYGSVDATPLFVMLAGLYEQRTGDLELIGNLWPALERAIAWIDQHGDCDGDGFVEYSPAAETGLANQGWKDSHDAVFHADGKLAKGPIALIEVQGYVYAAKRLAAGCAEKLGLSDRAVALREQAESLRQRFDDAFWCEEIGTYALALDGAKRPCKVRTSNAAHALTTGIARVDHARRVADCLAQTRFQSGWGIRTVATDAVRYNPMSYHNGSIWPHDNALIALGLAKYGCKGIIGVIFNGLIRATSYMEHRRIPELYCGFSRRPGRGPTLYPVACSPQAWAAGAPFLMLQSMLGLEFDHASRTVVLLNPALPPSTGRVVIRNLVLGDARIDFAVSQEGEIVSIQVLRSQGDLNVALQFDANPKSIA